MDRDIVFKISANATSAKKELNDLSRDVQQLRTEQNALTASSDKNTAAANKQSNSFATLRSRVEGLADARNKEAAATNSSTAAQDRNTSATAKQGNSLSGARAILEALTASHGRHAASVDSSTDAVSRHNSSTDKQTNSLSNAQRAIASVAEGFIRNASAANASSQATDNNSRTTQINAAINNMAAQMRANAARAHEESTAAADSNTNALNNNSNANTVNAASAQPLAAANDAAAQSHQDHTNSANQNTQALNNNSSAATQNTSSRRGLLETLSRLIQEENSYQGTLTSVTDATRKFDAASNNATRAMNNRIAAQRNLASAERDLAAASNDETSSAERIAELSNRVTTLHGIAANAVAKEERSIINLANAQRRLDGELVTSERTISRLRSAGQGVGSVFSGMGDGLRGVASAAGQFASVSIIPILLQLIPLIGSLGGGFIALASAMAPATGILAALPGILMGAGTAFGVLKSSFGGIGSAIKAYSTQQAAAASSADKNSQAAKQQAITIRNARQALQSAKENAARAESKAAQQVKDAEENAADSIKKAYRSLTDARRNAADANQEASKKVTEASRKAAEDNAKAAADTAKANRKAAEDNKAAARDTSDAMAKAASDNAKASKDVSDAVSKAAENDKRATAEVVSAREQAARSIAAAQQDIIGAEENLASAQVSAKRAQDDLSKARQDAVTYLKNMEKSVRDAAFSEEEAVLSLERARDRVQKTNNDPKASSLDRRQADLDYREAQARLSDARDARAKADTENADAQKKGVEGSDIMVNAYQKASAAAQKVVEAQTKLVASQQSLAQAQVQAAQKISDALQNQSKVHQEGVRSISDAEAKKAKVAQDGARAISDAQARQNEVARNGAEAIAAAQDKQTKTAKDGAAAIAEAKANQIKVAQDGNRSISDAEASLAKAQKDAARSIADAKASQAETIRSSNESVRKAQQSLNDALAKTDMGSASKQADAYKKALEKLTPAQRQFVDFLIKNKSKLEELKQAASASFLPLLQKGMENLFKSNMFDTLKTALSEMGSSLGQFALNVSNALSTKTNTDALGRVFHSNKVAMDNANKGAAGYTNALIAISDAARPLVEWLGKLVGDFGKYLDRVTKAKKANGDFAKSFGDIDGKVGKVQKTLTTLGHILRNIGNIFRGLGRASSDVGTTMLGEFEKWTKGLADFMNSAEGQDKLKDWFDGVKKNLDSFWPVLRKVGKLFAELTVSKGFRDFMDSMGKDGGALDSFGDLIKSISNSDMPKQSGETLGKIASAIGALVSGGGASAFVEWGKAVGLVADGLKMIADNPAGATLLQGLLLAAGATKALSVTKDVAKATGVPQVATRANKAITDRRTARRGRNAAAGAAAADAAQAAGEDPEEARNSVSRVSESWLAGARDLSRDSRRLGREAVAGFVQGTKDNIRDVKNAASTLASDFLERVRNLFRIHSPSREMAEIGGFVTQGFVNGISGKFDDVARAGNGLEDSLTNTLKTVPTGIKSAGEEAAKAYISGFKGASSKISSPTMPASSRDIAQAESAGSSSSGSSFSSDGSSRRDRRVDTSNDSTDSEDSSDKKKRGKKRRKSVDTGAVGEKADSLSGLVDMIPQLETLSTVLGLVSLAMDLVGGSSLIAASGEEVATVAAGEATVANEALAASEGAVAWPILAIIAAIALLAFAFYELYQHNETFRKAVDTSWNFIKNVISSAWNDYIKPAFEAMWHFITDNLVPAMQWFWQNVIVPAWNGISSAISWAWNNVIKPAFSAIWGFVQNNLIPVMMWLWKNVIVPAWNGISSAISWAWNNIIKPAFSAIWGFITGTLAPVFNTLLGVVKAVWGGIQTAISWAWNNIIKPVFNAMKDLISGNLSGAFTKLRDLNKRVWDAIWSVISKTWNWIRGKFWEIINFIGNQLATGWNNAKKKVEEVWNAIWTKIRDVWNWIRGKFWEIINFIGNQLAGGWNSAKKKVEEVWDGISRKISDSWTAIKGTLSKLTGYLGKEFRQAFEDAKTAVGKIWDGLKGIVEKPLKVVWNDVIGAGGKKGLIGKFNSLTKHFGAPEIKFAELASGGPASGRVPGSSPHARADNVPAMLTAGEWVQPVAAVQHYGPDFMEAIRRRKFPRDAARLASGGSVPAYLDREMRAEHLHSLRRKRKEGLSYYRDGGMAANTSQGVFSAAPSLSVATPSGLLSITSPSSTVEGAEHLAGGGGVPFRPSMHDKLIEYGKQLQKRGVAVLENPAFGKVHGGHMQGSLHYNGQALDVSGGPGWPSSGQRIYEEARKLGFAAIWQSTGHYDHVHIDTGMWSKYHDKLIKTGRTAGDNLSDLAGDIVHTLGGAPAELLKKAVTAVTSKIPGVNSPFGQMLVKMPLSIIDKMVASVEGMFDKFSNQGEAGTNTGEYTGGGNFDSWWNEAMKVPGASKYAQYKGWAKRLAYQESSFNPNAVNRDDLNARAGTPSAGLMQFIQPTFNRWKWPGHNQWMNPVDQILAFFRYADGQYGGVMRVPGIAAMASGKGYVPYAEGGPVSGYGNTDSVDAKLMPGEFVIRKAAVRQIGVNNLHALNNVDRPGRGNFGSKINSGTQHFATGGQVAPSGPVNGIKPGARGWGWKLIRQLFGLPINGRGFDQATGNWDGWWNDLTNAYKKNNYQVPTLEKISQPKAAPALGTLTKWMNSFMGGMKLIAQPTLKRFASTHWVRGRRVTTTSVKQQAPSMISVKEMQKIVGVTADGIIGRRTTTALRKYRSQHGLGDSRTPWDAMTRRFMSMDSFPNRWTGTIPRLWRAANNNKASMMSVAPWFAGANKDKLKANSPKALTGKIFWDAANMGEGNGILGSWIKDIQKWIGAAQTGRWGDTAQDESSYGDKPTTVNMSEAVKYVLDKGLKRPTATVFPPWWELDPLQQAIEKQTLGNKNQAEFLKALDTLSSWGLNYLVEDLQSNGVENGLPVAKAALNSRPLATQYNNELRRKKELDSTGTEDYTKFVATVQAPGDQMGIRKLAQELGMADFAIVDMWKKLVQSGRLKSGGERTARLERDVRLFDRGTFYANTGGRVPGAGDSDTVPAMLTPGEFVLRKAAVKAIGLDNLYKMNAQGYNAGGLVYDMGATSMRTDLRTLSSVASNFTTSNVSAQPVVVNNSTNINTNIYNPTRETSTKSYNRMLRRQAVITSSRVDTDTVNGEM